MQALGPACRWRGRALRHVARRVWRTYLAGRVLLRRRRMRGPAAQCWPGRVPCLNQLCPVAMSALSPCHRFVDEASDAPKRAWPSENDEIRCAVNLVFSMKADLGATYSDRFYCGGSSSSGHAHRVAQAEPGGLRGPWR